MNDQKSASNPAVRTTPPTIWIGLDWADRKHYLAILEPGASVPSGHFLEQKPETLDSFFQELRRKYPHAQWGVCVEQSRGPVIYALMKYDFVTIHPINPRALADFRRAFTVSGAKSDPRDGDLLCEFGAKHHSRLRALQLEEPAIRELRLLVEARRKFVDDRTGFGLKLLSALKHYFPLVLQLFPDDPCSTMAREFLRRWPNLQQLQSAKPHTLRGFFYKHNSRSEKLIQQRLDAIQAAVPLTEDSAIINPLQLQVGCLVDVITTLENSIHQCDLSIAKVFQRCSQASLFRDLPGAGEVLAPRLAALFGSQRENWTSAEEFQCWTGVAPVTKQSGNKSVVLFRRARPLFLHQTMVEFARSSIKFCAWARLLYEDQKKRGKSVFSAVRTVAFKWLRILFRCWKDNVAYDESAYLRSLQERGVKLYETLYKDLPPKEHAQAC